MPKASLPDGKEMYCNSGDSVAAVAKSIGPKIAKAAVAAEVNGGLRLSLSQTVLVL